MIVEFTPIIPISTPRVRFYTVKLGGASLSEFEKFDTKEFPEHVEEQQILYQVIKEMGLREAKLFYFKDERSAHALPKVPLRIIKANKKDFGLRLYCIHITNQIVILLNGGIKTAQNPLDCANVRNHFKLAVSLAEKIDRAHNNGNITWQGKLFTIDPYFVFEI